MLISHLLDWVFPSRVTRRKQRIRKQMRWLQQSQAHWAEPKE